MSALRLLAHRPGSFAVHGVIALLALPLTFCLIGVPVVAGILTSLASLCLEVAWVARGSRQDRPGGRGRWTAGLSILAVLGSLALASIAATEVAGSALALAGPEATRVLRIVAALVAPLALAACLSPLLFLPFAALDEGVGLADAAFRSAHVAARRGALRQIATALSATCWLVAPVALWLLVVPWTRGDRALQLTVWGLVLASAFLAFPAAFVTVAHAYVAGDPRDALPTRERATAALRAGRALFGAIVLLAAVLAGTLAVAALAPLPATPWGSTSRGRPRGFPLASTDGEHPTLPRTHVPGSAFSVRGTHDALWVEADDGGGVGEVRFHGGDRPTAVWAIRGRGANGEQTTELVVTAAGEAHPSRLLVDGQGVRVDDDVASRWSRRVGASGAALLAAIVVLALLAIWRVGSRLAAARHLGRPLSERDAARAPNEPARTRPLCAFEGRLRLGEHASVWVEPARWLFGRGTAEVHGLAWVEAADLQRRVRIPPAVVPAFVLEAASHPLSADAVVTVVGRFGRTATGSRESEIAWPSDGCLVSGDHAHAATATASEAMRAWAALAALLAPLLVATSLWVILRF